MKNQIKIKLINQENKKKKNCLLRDLKVKIKINLIMINKRIKLGLEIVNPLQKKKVLIELNQNKKCIKN